MRRRLLMGSAGGIDVISGKAVCSGTTLTMPIPAGYYMHAYNGSGRTYAEGDLREVHRDPYGIFRIKSAYSGAERMNSNPFATLFWITQSEAQIVLNCTNRNTTGLLADGDEWTFIAWKEEE